MTKRARDNLPQHIIRVGNTEQVYFERQNTGVRMRGPSGSLESAQKHASKAQEIIDEHSGNPSAIKREWSYYITPIGRQGVVNQFAGEGLHNSNCGEGLESICDGQAESQGEESHGGDRGSASHMGDDRGWGHDKIGVGNEGESVAGESVLTDVVDIPSQEPKLLRRTSCVGNQRRRSSAGGQEVHFIRWDYQAGFRERGQQLRKHFEDMLSHLHMWGCTITGEVDENGLSSDSAGFTFELPGSVRMILKRFPYFIARIDAITKAL